MKSLRYITLGCVLVLVFGSCKKWLDVNTDPDNPNNKSTLIQNRLPWIQHYYQYTAGVTNFRTSCQAGVYYSITASANAFSTTWTASSGNVTPYQQWFVWVASNLNDLYTSAQKQGAYDYMAAADVYHAMGYMIMLDLYGEMPYSQALQGNPSPAYDDGKTIYTGCIAKLNEAISLFSKTQEIGAPAFSAGDFWNNGDVNKWIKLCWGLKARYMLKLSKKTDLYNADSILYCLSKAPQNNADNIAVPGLDNSTQVDYLLADPIVTNSNWDYVGYGSNQRISQYYYNLLTNMRGSGVVDPRMTKIVPASGNLLTNTWNRSIGVDSYNSLTASDPLSPASRLAKGGAASIQLPTYADVDVNKTYDFSAASNSLDQPNFIAAQQAAGRPYSVNGSKVTVTYKKGSLYINVPAGATGNYIYAGDTAYVNLKSTSIATGEVSPTNLNWYPSTSAQAAGVVGSTGSFQVRAVSDQEILTYHEMCFIKAEVYMRKGDAANAYTAYRAGIQAHLDMMQAKLNQWKGTYAATNPDMGPMDPAAITSYLASNAVAQSAGALTMQDIMLQKYVAMGCSIENWNDMRRFNFSAGNVGGFGVVYPGYDRGALFAGSALYIGGSKTDPRYWQRRWQLPNNLELNYNLSNALAINPHAADPSIWSMPVWWDCATDAEYYGYLK